MMMLFFINLFVIEIISMKFLIAIRSDPLAR